MMEPRRRHPASINDGARHGAGFDHTPRIGNAPAATEKVWWHRHAAVSHDNTGLADAINSA
jgi:hypothetical protein